MSDHHFTAEMQNIIKQTFPLFNTTDDHNMGIINQFPDFDFSLASNHFQENLITTPQLCPAISSQDFPVIMNPLQHENEIVPRADYPPVIESRNNELLKMMMMNIDQTPESSLTHSSPAVSGTATKARTNCAGKQKRRRNCEDDEEEKNPREVVHVRAKRGQATDSHSLAERVRRGKINERLKCLQEIVPGCYKTMGMAVMLDEIINYVQSLQNQVEFLSMKLTAASTYHDFNSEIVENIRTMQNSKAYEELKMQKIVREGCEALEVPNQFIPFDHKFGCCYPSLPHNI